MTDNLSVVLVSEWLVNTPITELGDIARHSARWRGINRNFNFCVCVCVCVYLVYDAPPDFEFFSSAKKCGESNVNYGI